mmetsp:Transcript_20880/g.33646  ORF Transcript_20880/g.33646 Transcript_20880/m.33646 type:complete len:154 (-) Transcript_20880:123-584(-)
MPLAKRTRLRNNYNNNNNEKEKDDYLEGTLDATGGNKHENCTDNNGPNGIMQVTSSEMEIPWSTESERRLFGRIQEQKQQQQQQPQNTNDVWVNGINDREPWQWQYHDSGGSDWEESFREVRNFSTGILWLLVVRGVIVQCLRTRYRSDRVTG